MVEKIAADDAGNENANGARQGEYPDHRAAQPVRGFLGNQHAAGDDAAHLGHANENQRDDGADRKGVFNKPGAGITQGADCQGDGQGADAIDSVRHQAEQGRTQQGGRIGDGDHAATPGNGIGGVHAQDTGAVNGGPEGEKSAHHRQVTPGHERCGIGQRNDRAPGFREPLAQLPHDRDPLFGDMCPAFTQAQKHQQGNRRRDAGHGQVGGPGCLLRVHAAAPEDGGQLEQEEGGGHGAQPVHHAQQAGRLAAAVVGHIVRHQCNHHGADRGDTGGVDDPGRQQPVYVPGHAVQQNAQDAEDKAHNGDQAAPHPVRQ